MKVSVIIYIKEQLILIQTKLFKRKNKVFFFIDISMAVRDILNLRSPAFQLDSLDQYLFKFSPVKISDPEGTSSKSFILKYKNCPFKK
jgi:hypothetical protein